MTRLYKILLPFCAIIMAVSCEEAEYFNGELIDPEVVIRFPNAGGFEPFGATFTELDNVIIDVAVEGNVSTLTVGITDSTDNFGTVNISNGMGTFEASPEQLGIPDARNEAQLRFTATLPGGGTTTRLFDIEITDPVTIAPPIFIQQNDEDNYLTFSAATDSASIDNITVMVGTDEDALSTVPAPMDGWNAKGDSIAIVGGDYEVGDTVLVNVTASSGSATSSSQSSAIVRTYNFPNESETIAFDSVGAGYDLVAGGASIAGADTTDIELTVDNTLNTIRISSQNETRFVQTSGLYNEGDVVAVREAYEAGMPATASDDLEEGDELIYRTERTVNGETQVYYGIIQITDVNRTNEGNDSVSLRYRFE